MKLFTATVALTTLVLSPLAWANECKADGTISDIGYHITVPRSDIVDPDGLCGGFKTNIQRWILCRPKHWHCGMEGAEFKADFRVGSQCNAGMIGSSWYEQTKNQYGSISC
ncbi:hypothetical protein PG994_002736 [Apiospora phragmitis]|uniref:Uncharacterized protein n=1 Tax=Apiospora phragmitis TaxID=2905665 RepID=A0ABR1W5Z2_9PEZI